MVHHGEIGMVMAGQTCGLVIIFTRPVFFRTMETVHSHDYLTNYWILACHWIHWICTVLHGQILITMAIRTF